MDNTQSAVNAMEDIHMILVLQIDNNNEAIRTDDTQSAIKIVNGIQMMSQSQLWSEFIITANILQLNGHKFYEQMVHFLTKQTVHFLTKFMNRTKRSVMLISCNCSKWKACCKEAPFSFESRIQQSTSPPAQLTGSYFCYYF